MARANLTAMLGRLDDDKPITSPAPTAVADAGAAPAAPATAASSERATAPVIAKKTTSAKPRTPTAPPSTPKAVTPRAEQPLFLRLERKETRLRADQYADLTAHARRLSQAKTGGGERITENTLIRVAIDLLLERATQLSGDTEAEIRNSVTL